MQDQIIQALKERRDLKDWCLRHITTSGAQLYAVPKVTEAQRRVSRQYFIVDVLRETRAPNGDAACGSGNATLLPGGDISAALDAASFMAGLVSNPPHGIPGPAEMPQVPLLDKQLKDEPESALEELHESIRTAVKGHPGVRLTSAEFFVDTEIKRLTNSRGIDADQIATHIHLGWVLTAQRNENAVESFVQMSRRRLTDLDLEFEAARHAQYTNDLLSAKPPEDYNGPVILRDTTLGTFLNATVLKLLSSSEFKYKKVTPWEINERVLTDEVEGDPLTVWANRQLPFGTNANRFDDEGLPAQRVLLIQDNKLMTFTTDQRYADYLSLPPTGAFGDIELPPGATPSSELLVEPHVEVVTFSWFNPDPLTGDFASEIRLGYFVGGGKRTPFKGGMLVGNILKGLTNVHYSAETGFYGDYQGPVMARFGNLTVAGK